MFQQTLKTTLTALTVLILAAVPLLGDNVLEVRCLDPDGNPIRGVKVYLQGLTSEDRPEDEKSSRSGIAVFDKLPDDFYRVWAHQKNFESTYHEFTRLHGNQKQQVTLNFTPGDHEKPLYFEDPQIVDRAQTLLREGSQAIQQNQPEIARTKLQECISLYPSNVDAYHNLSILHIQQQEWDQAEENLAKTAELLDMFLTISPDSQQLKQQQQTIQTLTESIPMRRLIGEADEAMKAREWESASTKLEQLSKMQSNNPTIFYHWSVALINQQKLDQAETIIDKALAIKPDEEAFQNIKKQIDRRRTALAAEKARLAMVAIQGLNSEGKSELALSRIEAAKDTMTEELKPIMWEEKAKAHLALEQYDEALKSFQMVFELKEQPVTDGLYELAQDLNRKGKQDGAFQVYEFILQIDPEFPEVYYELGMEYFYGTNQDKDKAKQMLEKYLEIGTDEAHKSNASNVLAVIEKG